MTVGVEAVEVLGPTGQVLRGQRWGGGINVVILVHAPGGDLDAWGDLPLHLADGDLAAIAFDLPGHGLSDDPWEPGLLAGSIRAVVDQVRVLGAARVFLVVAAATVPCALRVAAAGGVDALVALSPPDLRDDRDVVDGQIAMLPKLLLVGADDQGALASAQGFFRRSTGWTVLSTLPTRKQGTDLVFGSWGRQALEQIAVFLRDYQAFDSHSGSFESDASGASR